MKHPYLLKGPNSNDLPTENLNKPLTVNVKRKTSDMETNMDSNLTT